MYPSQPAAPSRCTSSTPAPLDSTQDEVLAYLRTVPQGITFVHGKAGCGKTYLIRKIESQLHGCKVLTPTNLSATLYKGASTLHSFFYAAFDSLEEGIQDPANITPVKAHSMRIRLQAVRMLVFDEISMVRADTFEMIHRICCLAMQSDLPFGGIPIVVVGDLLQLPPVVSHTAIEQYLYREYGGIYFFDSHVVKDNLSSIRLFELSKSYRQLNDPEFVEILDAFRSPLTASRKIELLDKINKRVTPRDRLPRDAVYIASANEEVAKVNTDRLDRLPGDTMSIPAQYSIRLKGTSRHLSISHTDLPTPADIEPIVVPSAYDPVLFYKPGARVTITKSARRFGYCNGDMGTVESFNGTFFTIMLDSGKRICCPDPRDPHHTRQITEDRYEITYDSHLHKLRRQKTYLQRTVQYPIKPAYAFTIHKSQGQTYDKVILDLESHIFAPGQLYVALSRAKTLDGLFLTKPLSYSDIISDDHIFGFLSALRTAHWQHLEEEECEKTPNPRCDDFMLFVRLHETDPSVRHALLQALDAYKKVFAHSRHSLAMAELAKAIDIVNASYITDRYAGMIDRMRARRPSEEDCRYNLNAIFEIYTDVISLPRSQFATRMK